MASTINAKSSGAGGIEYTGDASGTLGLQANGSTIATVSSTGMAVTGALTTTGAITSNGVVSSPYTMKNRIINGDMRIDQRNAGAAVTANGSFPVDRFKMNNTTDGTFSAQQSSTVPSGGGFVNSVLITVTSADTSLTTTQRLALQQTIEGYNVADLGWGTAAAKTITLSFWVRSSLTGTFSGSLRNSAGDRSYPYTYTISSANTWEQKTITIPGDTTGTWMTTNGEGIILFFSLGVGPSLLGTANTWASAGYWGATGETSLIGTNGATFYITGVQLEAGSVATNFEWRHYGQELALCQRYFQKVTDIAVRVFGQPTNGFRLPNYYKVTMRANPTVTLSGSGLSTTSVYGQSPDQFSYSNNDGSCDMYFSYTASAEL